MITKTTAAPKNVPDTAIIEIERISDRKGTDNIPDYQKVYNSFLTGIKTMMQVTVITSIPTQYICRYVAMFRKKELIQIHHLGRCPITGEDNVQLLTADVRLFKSNPMPKQFDLFDNEQS